MHGPSGAGITMSGGPPGLRATARESPWYARPTDATLTSRVGGPLGCSRRLGYLQALCMNLVIVQHSSICDFTKTGIRHSVHIFCHCDRRIQVESRCRSASPGRKSLCRSGEAPRTARRWEIKDSSTCTARRSDASGAAGYRDRPHAVTGELIGMSGVPGWPISSSPAHHRKRQRALTSRREEAEDTSSIKFAQAQGGNQMSPRRIWVDSAAKCDPVTVRKIGDGVISP